MSLLPRKEHTGGYVFTRQGLPPHPHCIVLVAAIIIGACLLLEYEDEVVNVFVVIDKTIKRIVLEGT